MTTGAAGAQPLEGEDGVRVALVAGATRGVGRGVAVALGAAGWTVWVSGRSGREHGATSHLPGTVEETAQEVTAGGGRGLPVVCDHRDDDQVAGLVTRIAGESGRLDLLVNAVWAGYERLNAGAWQEWNAPFWEQPVDLWDAMFTGGVRAHYVCTRACAPLLRATPGSLVVTVSMGVDAPGEPVHGVAYTVAKIADDRLAAATAAAFAADAVTSVALHPGLVRTEGVLQFAEHLDLTSSQSPQGVGRVVAALAADGDRLRLSGQALTVAGLARDYGVDTLS